MLKGERYPMQTKPDHECIVQVFRPHAGCVQCADSVAVCGAGQGHECIGPETVLCSARPIEGYAGPVALKGEECGPNIDKIAEGAVVDDKYFCGSVHKEFSWDMVFSRQLEP